MDAAVDATRARRAVGCSVNERFVHSANSFKGDRMSFKRLACLFAALASGACGGSAAAPTRTGVAGSSPAGSSGASGAVGGSGAAGDNGAAGATGPAPSGAAGDGAGVAGVGAAGSSSAAGASPAGPAGAPADGGVGDASAARGDYVCTELIGLWVASQWWSSFEKGVDGNKWEFMFQHHGYLEMFADPASPYWMNAVSSKCTMSAATPDRVVFLPFSLSLNTMDEWVTNLTKAVETMKGKFPGVKRIELMTTLRSPGNVPCANDNDPNTVVPPYVDAAIQTVADASGGLVTVGPKIEVGNCNWWAGGTDLTGAGNTGAGQLLAAYYQTH